MNNDQLSGIIDKFLFSNEETGYSVFILNAKKNDKTTVTGVFANIQAGQEIHLEGSWNFHAKFGKQFLATTYTTTLPTSIVGIKKYLGSGFIKGIGKVYAEKIVNHFKEKTLELIDSDPDRLRDVEGIGAKRVEQIKQSWVDQKFIAKIMVFLQEKGVTSTFATKIYKKYGHEAIAKLTENPYRLTEDIWGIGFKMADQIAQNMGFATGSVQRLQAGIIHSLSQATGNGHVYQEVDTLKNNTFQLLELDPELHQAIMKEALTSLYNQDKIKLLTHNKQHFITTSALYNSEKSIAQKLLKLVKSTSKWSLSDQELYDVLQDNMQSPLNDEQQQGVISCLQQKVSIITGGPGTGKTTTLATLLKMLDHYQVSYKLAAPTGRAAKRMMESTKRHAMTIHRMLEFDPSVMKFQRNEQNALQTDMLIIDEASMLDVYLMNSIVKATAQQTHLVFIGDIDQLPSVGPGNVLKDMIESKKVACTKLVHIFRQAQNSMIIQNAHRINQGEFPISSLPECKKDFYFIKNEQPEQTFEKIKQILHKATTQLKIPPEKITILTPMNRGVVGTHKLNHDLQQLLNGTPTKEQASFAGTTYKKLDRVMQIRNNYDKKVFNGDIGTVQAIDLEDKNVIVDFYGQSISYAFDELNELALAYAVTIHKSQGSEYDAVIIPIFMQHFMLLQRNLIYTAITRAKKLCIFVGQSKAIAMGVKNAKQEDRITFLNIFLTENLSCR